MSEEEINIILTELNCKQGDVVFIVADKNSVTLPVLGALRLKVAKQLISFLIHLTSMDH